MQTANHIFFSFTSLSAVAPRVKLSMNNSHKTALKCTSGRNKISSPSPSASKRIATGLMHQQSRRRFYVGPIADSTIQRFQFLDPGLKWCSSVLCILPTSVLAEHSTFLFAICKYTQNSYFKRKQISVLQINIKEQVIAGEG